jgi:DNA replication and repair protein RecF
VRITQLRLENFRNIPGMEFHPGEDANIIFGENAQGKTNILEAIWLFTGARSFRGTKDSEFIRFGQTRCTLSLEFFADGREQTASIVFGEGKKLVKLNEIPQAGISRLAGEFRAVFFSPDHLLLIKQGPENRRRMLDVSLCQAYPKYAKILDSYQKILRQRASLLKDIPRNASLTELLDAWDKSLIDYVSYITAVRTGYTRQLARHAAEIYAGISGGRESLTVTYQSTAGQGDCQTRGEYREQLAIAIKQSRSADIAHGLTTIGPHRDDVEIAINGSSARSFGSQGQQRSCVLALKLAECAILEERGGEPPVVLLDDVMSELDELRRGYLLNKLRDMQILITCCDAAVFEALAGGKVFPIAGGALV